MYRRKAKWGIGSLALLLALLWTLSPFLDAVPYRVGRAVVVAGALASLLLGYVLVYGRGPR
ncbi:hypothetical protein [Halogeometricum luteum]|uniref:Uncharacterized protein n=1 Tax=Halogeometricum luteum TaxID=2950537 RepID=A0ABU2G0T5_9EURY|nr:hypothetical protein [Halogeometricum sp. S3BR5-2]MDS0294389.1 hypothetical protein [Halogeometricum sp. S3BR5-2]